MSVEFVYSGMRVTKSTGGSIPKENSDTKVERTKVMSGPGKGLKIHQLSFQPYITVHGRHTVGTQLI